MFPAATCFVAAVGVALMVRARSNDGTPINLTSELERYFAGVHGGPDFVIGEQLVRCMASREGNLDFFPDRIEAIAGNCINDRNKRLTSGQTEVRLIDEVERCVVLNKRLLSRRREFH